MAVSGQRFAPPKKVSRVSATSAALFVLALVLSMYSGNHPWTGDLRLQIATLLLKPLRVLDIGARQKIEALWVNYVALIDVQRKNHQLNSQIQALEGDKSRLEESNLELQRLRELLGIKQQIGQQSLVANVIGRDPSNWVFAVTIDKGYTDGVRAGLAVVSGQSLIGQVVNVAANSSRVLLISDYSSGVDVLLQSTRARAVVAGAGEDCELQYLNRDEEVKVGDKVITSGLDGIFSKGILVGIVSEINDTNDAMFHNVRVKPLSTLNKLEEVLVLGVAQEKDSPSPPVEVKKQ